MSEPTDPHLEMLRNIWGEMKTVNARINTTNERLEATNGHLASFERRVDARLEAIEGRLETMDARLDIHGRGITKLVDEVAKLNTRVENILVGAHGREHDELRSRVEDLEKHTGLR